VDYDAILQQQIAILNPMKSNDYYWKVCEIAVTCRVKPNDILREAGISNTTLHRWKTGDAQPTTRTWERVIEAAQRLKAKAHA
jgi:hypothetical protein